MIWLTWRQLRTSALAVFGALAALAAVLAGTGPGIADAYTRGIAACTASGDCSTFLRTFFQDHERALVGASAVVLVLPALLGLFWGAPLVARELETGTHRLVWSQTVTRSRWLAVKLGLGGLAAAAAAGLATLAVSWWASPLDQAAVELPRMAPPIFGTRGIAPIGYAAFAFALGVAAGLVLRRTVAAMAVALVGFIAVQIAVPLWIRPHLIPPVHAMTAITADNLDGISLNGGNEMTVEVTPPDSAGWTISDRTVDAAGRPVDALSAEVAAACGPQGVPGAVPPPPGGSRVALPARPGFRQECLAAIAAAGYQQEVVYQPPSRFWPLQWAETGMFLGLALALAAFCFRRIRRLS